MKRFGVKMMHKFNNLKPVHMSFVFRRLYCLYIGLSLENLNFCPKFKVKTFDKLVNNENSNKDTSAPKLQII